MNHYLNKPTYKYLYSFLFCFMEIQFLIFFLLFFFCYFHLGCRANGIFMKCCHVVLLGRNQRENKTCLSLASGSRIFSKKDFSPGPDLLNTGQDAPWTPVKSNVFFTSYLLVSEEVNSEGGVETEATAMLSSFAHSYLHLFNSYLFLSTFYYCTHFF